MIDLTVRRVATFLRLPWWISMLTMFLDGREKQTARWDRSFVSFPVSIESANVPTKSWGGLCSQDLVREPSLKLSPQAGS